MAERANIRDIQAITELQSALGRFAGNTQEALTTIEAEIARTQTWIQQQAQRGRHQILQARQTLQQAQAALNRCRSQVVIGSGGVRRPPDCRAENRAVTEAQRRLRETEAQFQKVQQWQTHLSSAVERYRRLARKLHELTTTQTKRAQARLGQQVSRLEQYVNLRSFEIPATFSQTQLQQAVDSSSIWQGGWAEYGRRYEEAWGANIAGNFPTIDDFRNGRATSLKAVNLQNSYLGEKGSESLRSTLTGYVDKLASFEGKKGYGAEVKGEDVHRLVLQIAVPPRRYALQEAVLQEVASYGQQCETSLGVPLEVVFDVVP